MSLDHDLQNHPLTDEGRGALKNGVAMANSIPRNADAVGPAAPLDLNPLIFRLNAVKATISTCRHALRKLDVDGCDDIELVLRRHAESELLEIIEQLMDRLREVRHG